MEAPVPASALIHSATLVSAGVFLIVRLAPLFEISVIAKILLPVVGSTTAFFGGLCATAQTDIKRILAYSTISHCGFLMVCCSTFCSELVMVYLYVHGFFKAGSFLCAGNVIRFNYNVQDLRKTGGFFKYLPFETYAMFVCLANLMGLPFTLGFYIKHILILSVYLNNFFFNFVITMLVSGALTSIIYCSRLFFNIFFDIKKANKRVYMINNRKELSSVHYSNSTRAATYSITALIIVAYISSGLLINIFFLNPGHYSGINLFSLENPLHYDVYDHNSIRAYTEKNMFVLNLLIIMVMLICYTSS